MLLPPNNGEGPKAISGLNTYAGTIPAYALVRVTGSTTSNEFNLDQPDTDGGHVWVNGPLAIGEDDGGSVFNEFPVFAQYDDGDGTPAIGETWGAGNGSWKLRKDNAGFRICGTPDTTLKIVAVEREFAAAAAAPLVAEGVNYGAGSSSSIIVSGASVAGSGAPYIQVDRTKDYLVFCTCHANFPSAATIHLAMGAWDAASATPGTPVLPLTRWRTSASAGDFVTITIVQRINVGELDTSSGSDPAIKIALFWTQTLGSGTLIDNVAIAAIPVA